MKSLDTLLQNWRIKKAVPYITGSRLLDIGCFDGSLFDFVGQNVTERVGIDSLSMDEVGLDDEALKQRSFRRIEGEFPAAFAGEKSVFDTITMLAVVEHFTHEALATLPAACAEHLVDNGQVVITMPSPLVDPILDVLMVLRIVDGMSTEEHHGMKLQHVIDAFTQNGFSLEVKKSFQLGLNNLVVFKKR